MFWQNKYWSPTGQDAFRGEYLGTVTHIHFRLTKSKIHRYARQVNMIPNRPGNDQWEGPEGIHPYP